MKKSKIDLLSLISYFYVSVGLWGLLSLDNSNTMFYVFTVGYVFLVACLLVLSHRILIVYQNRCNRIPIMIIMVWIFGFIIGMIKNNTTEYLMKNFAGMILYFVFYIFVGLELNIHVLEKIIMILSIAVILFTCGVYVMQKRGLYSIAMRIPLMNCFMLNGDETGYIGVWYNAIGLLPFWYICCLYKCLHSGKFAIKDLLIISVNLAVMMICSRMGGVEAIILGTTILLYFSEIGSYVNKNLSIIGIIAVIVVVLFLVIKDTNPFEVVFGTHDGGNRVRYEQINYVLSHLSVFGHGLGAKYGEIGKGYAIEVIYLDIIYKFGIAVIPIFYAYFFTFTQAIKLMKKGTGRYADAFPFALMSYSFIALGNPILFSPTSVLCHVIALMIIQDRSYLKITCNQMKKRNLLKI